jgi:hypothetical protein
VFTHVTKFAYVKQPAGSRRDAYYALHHMQAFVRDQENIRLSAHLQQWARHLAIIQDSDLKREFFHIQTRLSSIIWDDVVRKGGDFYCSTTPTNERIDTILDMQRDGREKRMMNVGIPVIRERAGRKK